MYDGLDRDDFTAAYSEITAQMAKIKEIHEDYVAQISEQVTSAEQFSMLISSLIQFIPQQIMVIDQETRSILIMNEAAIMEMHKDPEYIENVIGLMAEHEILPSGTEAEIVYDSEGINRYFQVRAFATEWDGRHAEIYVIEDISNAKREIEELEEHAYHDSLTGLYNRTYGMKTLEEWIEQRKRFVLLFADLDMLKYVNDVFGHNEGDLYIINAAKHLRGLQSGAVVCRLGGDEFMAIIPNVGYDDVVASSAEVYANLADDEHQRDKEFNYSMSVGFVEVGVDNTLDSAAILSLADERMYENKRARKKDRRV